MKRHELLQVPQQRQQTGVVLAKDVAQAVPVALIALTVYNEQLTLVALTVGERVEPAAQRFAVAELTLVSITVRKNNHPKAVVFAVAELALVTITT